MSPLPVPVATSNDPAAAFVLLPVVTVIEPPAPSVLPPPVMTKLPASPLSAVPVDNVTSPETVAPLPEATPMDPLPAADDAGLRKVMSPDDALTLLPVSKLTLPPAPPVDEPACRDKAPPEPVLVAPVADPLVIDTDPPLCPAVCELSPATINTDPPWPAPCRRNDAVSEHRSLRPRS